MEKKGRGGKTVTVLAPKEPGFAGQADRARILEQLKTRLGSGGSLQPDGSLLLQGDVRQRLDDQGLITN